MVVCGGPAGAPRPYCRSPHLSAENAAALLHLRQASFARWFAEILPLTHFLRLIRGVKLRGTGLRELWSDVLALAVFVGVMMAVTILRFRKRLD